MPAHDSGCHLQGLIHLYGPDTDLQPVRWFSEKEPSTAQSKNYILKGRRSLVARIRCFSDFDLIRRFSPHHV